MLYQSRFCWHKREAFPVPLTATSRLRQMRKRTNTYGEQSKKTVTYHDPHVTICEPISIKFGVIVVLTDVIRICITRFENFRWFSRPNTWVGKRMSPFRKPTCIDCLELRPRYSEMRQATTSAGICILDFEALYHLQHSCISEFLTSSIPSWKSSKLPTLNYRNGDLYTYINWLCHVTNFNHHYYYYLK